MCDHEEGVTPKTTIFVNIAREDQRGGTRHLHGSRKGVLAMEKSDAIGVIISLLRYFGQLGFRHVGPAKIDVLKEPSRTDHGFKEDPRCGHSVLHLFLKGNLGRIQIKQRSR